MRIYSRLPPPRKRADALRGVCEPTALVFSRARSPFMIEQSKKGHHEGAPFCFGLPDRIRTYDLKSRSLARYPAVPRVDVAQQRSAIIAQFSQNVNRFFCFSQKFELCLILSLIGGKIPQKGAAAAPGKRAPLKLGTRHCGNARMVKACDATFTEIGDRRFSPLRD